MTKYRLEDLRKILPEDLKNPQTYEAAMEAISGGSRKQQIQGPKRLFICCARRTYAPGEKSVLLGSEFEDDFQFDHVVVPDDVTFDPSTGKVRLYFHHEQFVLPGHRVPASLFLRAESAQIQRLDYYSKHVFAPGESFEVGIFENVGGEPLDVRVGIVGYMRDRRSGTSAGNASSTQTRRKRK